jgi:hypothetical protein
VDSFAWLICSDVETRVTRLGEQWVNVYFEQWFENYRSNAHFWATFFRGASCALILTKKLIGRHFGRLLHKLIWSPWWRQYHQLAPPGTGCECCRIVPRPSNKEDNKQLQRVNSSTVNDLSPVLKAKKLSLDMTNSRTEFCCR